MFQIHFNYFIKVHFDYNSKVFEIFGFFKSIVKRVARKCNKFFLFFLF
jgi:hypothetical protein